MPAEKFQGSFKGVSRKIEGCVKVPFEWVSSVFERKKERKFQESFKEESKEFQGGFKRVLRKFQWYFQKVSRVFKGILKGVSRKTRVFERSSKRSFKCA